MPIPSNTPTGTPAEHSSSPDSTSAAVAKPSVSPRRSRPRRPRLRLVASDGVLLSGRRRRKRTRRPVEAGTTTAEYTVVTAAAVAFGALLLKLLTGTWGTRILETAFQHVIALLGL